MPRPPPRRPRVPRSLVGVKCVTCGHPAHSHDRWEGCCRGRLCLGRSQKRCGCRQMVLPDAMLTMVDDAGRYTAKDFAYDELRRATEQAQGITLPPRLSADEWAILNRLESGR